MSARDNNWLCPQHPFGHQWGDKLNCELCGAERSAADAIVSVLSSARGWDSADAERVRDAFAAEVRAADIALIEDRACDADFTEEPLYIVGLRSAADLLKNAVPAAPVPDATAGDETELERLRIFAEATARRHQEIRDRLALVDIR